MESTQENLEYLKEYFYVIPAFIFMNKQVEKRIEFFLDAKKQVRAIIILLAKEIDQFKK